MVIHQLHVSECQVDEFLFFEEWQAVMGLTRADSEIGERFLLRLWNVVQAAHFQPVYFLNHIPAHHAVEITSGAFYVVERGFLKQDSQWGYALVDTIVCHYQNNKEHAVEFEFDSPFYHFVQKVIKAVRHFQQLPGNSKVYYWEKLNSVAATERVNYIYEGE